METYQIEKQIAEMKAKSNIVIATQRDYERTADMLKNIIALRKKIVDTFSPIIKKAHEAHKEAKAQERKHLEPVTEIENALKKKCKEWENKLEQIRLEELRKAEEKKARMIEQAKEEAEWGNTDKANEMFHEVAETKTELPSKITGLGIRRTWKFEVINELDIPREYLIPNLSKIGQEVRTLKDKCMIPGIKVYQE